MELVGNNFQTMAYIQSESEFNRASNRGAWERVINLLIGRTPYLLCFKQVVDRLQPYCPVELGVQDIPVKQIIGSVGRNKDFTRHFWPAMSNRGCRERWRAIYTRAVTGAGFPPIEIYKIGPDYFVKDGHHRVSVARYLGWPTVQANVIELLVSGSGAGCQVSLYNGVDLCC